MHAETDQATYYATMSRLTGHSPRYLRVRACVRAALVVACTLLPFAHALTPTR